ncbi:N-6 DNA methylase [Geminisphaera colitermitum]|uniref:N-6 DNA methylase n=1 Tax=Geminisphaera colitermitum TaxID=1148786 RepID=UPI000158D188|nr:N-6 DNA methylase [Geminisphaera colitermitum]
MSSSQASPTAIIIAQGKLLDFIDGITQRDETPEEYVRQEIAKSLVREYGYGKQDIAVEFKVKLGSSSKRADLVIFPSGSGHSQENALMIVECKRQDVKPADKKDGVAQLESYLAACPNAKFGMWTNGLERICYRVVVRKGERTVAEIPDLPTFGRDEEDAERPLFDQLKPATSDALLFAFRRCHNYIAGNQGLQKPQAFWELLKLIFCKIHDERHNEEVQFYAGATERQSVNGHLKVKERIETLWTEVKSDYGAIFSPAEGIGLEPRVLAYLVSQLQMYSLLESDVDVKGRAYEEIVGSNLRGDRGEFFTPRNICQMAIAMLDPGEHQLILDPCCGTGGFLITAMNHVIEKIRDAEVKKWKGKPERALEPIRARIQKFASKFIAGIDFNPELVKASKMNMVMNNDGAGGLFQANSLENPAVWSSDLRARNLMGKVDLLFTNPPFGSKIPITDPAILEQYDLGHAWSYDKTSDRWMMQAGTVKSQPPEILFIERCVKFLRSGGRCAIVLPDGILGSPGLGYVREWILRHARILASIDLHPDTFQPLVSIQTSVLVLERKDQQLVAIEQAAGKLNDYCVFMAVANHIGHDKRGNKTYVRNKDGSELVRELVRSVLEYENGIPVYKSQRVQMKEVDDNTQQIAHQFRQWLSEQD